MAYRSKFSSRLMSSSDSAQAVKKTVFENGLTLVSERVSNFRSLAMGVWVKIGTRHETPRIAGASHFLEHMLFKGTQARTALEIAREIDQVGGEFNAFTTREQTCFHVLLLDRDYRLGLDILSDVVLNSNFKSDELERERKVILQELSMVEETPEELAHDVFFELIYGKHGLGQPILGTEKSIRRLKREHIIQFFRHHYRPEQLVISVVGDVSHNEIKKNLAPLLKDRWPGRSKQVSPNPLFDSFEPAPPILSGSWWMNRPTEQVHLIWGVPGPTYTSEDRFAAFLLNVYLGGGMSSALFQEVREKHALAYTVYSCLSPLSDSGIFSIYCATNVNQVPLCLKLIEKCLSRLRKKELSKAELRTVKNNLKGTLLLSTDSVESRMSRIARNELFLGQEMTTEEVCRRIDQVTPNDLKRLANQLFQEGKASVLALGPKPKGKLPVGFKLINLPL